MPQLIVDLHVHSHYSYATSKQMNALDLYRWGKIKGIEIIGTGDCLHPAYLRELEDQLEPAEDGLFTLKKDLAAKQDALIPESCRGQSMRFLLTVEVSCIYHRHGKLRKVHNVITFPDFKSVHRLVDQLKNKSNLAADGRPTLTIDSADLLEQVLEIDDRCLFIPAHVWTPWFGLFGSKSGFESLEEAFGKYKGRIFALETGLSSDPPMNWSWSELDGVTMVSHSDAHSPPKLGREANVIDAELSYRSITEAIKTGDDRFVGTIEFFPQEGKYHFDGHRKCQVCFSPEETQEHNGVCPVCGKPVVIGVQNRIDSKKNQPPNLKRKQVEYIVPLPEILAEIVGVKSVKSKKVEQLFEQSIQALGNEFDILRTCPINHIHAFNPDLARAIDNMRQGKISVTPGYDGEYGRISVVDKNTGQKESQPSLF